MLRLILAVTGRSVLMAVVVVALASCSGGARKVRLLQRADHFFDSGEYEKAKIEYSNALGIDGTDTATLRQLGIIWLEEGAPLRAYPYFARAKELEPDNTIVRTKLAATFAALGENARATKEAIAVLKESPALEEALSVLIGAAESKEDFAEAERQLWKIPEENNAFYHLAFAKLALRAGQLAYASSEAEQAIQLRPKSPEAHLAMAAVQWRQQDLAKAAEQFAAATELAPPRSETPLEYGKFEVAIGHSEKARAILTETIQRTPDYLSAWCALAQIAISNQQYKEAHSLLENVFNRDGGNVEAGILESQAWLREHETEKAINRLESLASSYQHAPFINCQLAQAYLINNNVMQAVAVLNDALSVKPDYADAILLLAQADLQLGKPEAVLAPLSSLLKRVPGLVPAELLLVEAYRKLGRLDDATAIYRDEVRLSPQSADAYARLGAILREQHEIGEAEDALTTALKLSPGNVLGFEQLVELYISKKDFVAADRLIQQRLAADPKSAVAYLALGKSCAAQAQWANAIVAFHKALDADPTSPGTLNLLISSYVSANQLTQAVAELNGFLSKNPSDLNALRNLARVYEKLERYSDARATYEEILSLNPDASEILNNLAYLYAEHFDEVDRACELARKARALQPYDPAIADTLGWSLYKNGDYGEAVTLLRESAGRFPENLDAQFHFGMACYVMGELKSARQALQKAVSKGTDFPGAAEAQRRLTLLQNQSALSVDDVEKITAQQPEDVIAWMSLASLRERQRAFPKAAAAYEEALTINPELLPAAVKLAELNLGPLQNKEMAYAFAKRAKDLSPDDPKVTGILGNVACQLGNFPWAYSLLTESVRRLPDNASNLHTLAFSAYMLAKVGESRRLMRRVLDLHPDQKLTEQANSFIEMTELEQKSEDLAGFERQIQKVLANDPSFVPALLAKAKLQIQRGDSQSAIDIYTDLLRLYPDFPLAQKYLAELYLDDPVRSDEAYSLALKARNALPADRELASTLGEISYKKQNYPYAVECFYESARHAPLRGKELYYLGMAQIQTGEITTGEQALTRALNTGLQEPLATQARQRLAAAQSTK